MDTVTIQSSMSLQVDEGYREEMQLRNKLLDEQRDIVYSSLPIPEVRVSACGAPKNTPDGMHVPAGHDQSYATMCFCSERSYPMHI